MKLFDSTDPDKICFKQDLIRTIHEFRKGRGWSDQLEFSEVPYEQDSFFMLHQSRVGVLQISARISACIHAL